MSTGSDESIKMRMESNVNAKKKKLKWIVELVMRLINEYRKVIKSRK